MFSDIRMTGDDSILLLFIGNKQAHNSKEWIIEVKTTNKMAHSQVRSLQQNYHTFLHNTLFKSLHNSSLFTNFLLLASTAGTAVKMKLPGAMADADWRLLVNGLWSDRI